VGQSLLLILLPLHATRRERRERRRASDADDGELARNCCLVARPKEHIVVDNDAD
jgi:hypothetical protein